MNLIEFSIKDESNLTRKEFAESECERGRVLHIMRRLLKISSREQP